MTDPRADLYERYRDQGLSHEQALRRIQQADQYESLRDSGASHDDATRQIQAGALFTGQRADFDAAMQAARRTGGPTEPGDPSRGERSLLGRATSIPRAIGRDVTGGLISGAMRVSDALNPLGDPLRETREALDARRQASREAQHARQAEEPVAGLVENLATEGAKYGIVGAVAPSLVAQPAIRGGSAIGRVATRALRDASQQGLAETALGLAEGNSADELAHRQRVGAGYGAAFGGALQAGGEALRGVRGMRRARVPEPEVPDGNLDQAIQDFRRAPERVEDLPSDDVIAQTVRGPRPRVSPTEPIPPIPDEELPDLIRPLGERGAAVSGVVQSIAGAGTGALTGAAVDDENPIRGALAGAAIGAGLPAAGSALIRRVNRLPAVADDVRRITPQEPGPASAVAPEHPVNVHDYARLSKFALDPSGEQRLGQEIERVVQRYGLAPKQRITWDQTRTIAAQIGLDPNDILTRQGRLSGPDMLAIRNIVADNTRQLVRLESQRAAGNLSEEAAEQLSRQIAGIEGQNNALLSRFTRERSQTGRDLNNLKILASTSLDPAAWFARAERLKGKQLLAAEQGEIARLLAAGDRSGVAKYVADLRKAPLHEYLINIWRAGLLTGFRTHEANLVGNLTMAGLETAKDAPGVLWDRLLGLAFNGRRTKALTSDVFAASVRGARAGAREAKQIMRRGVVDDAAQRFDQVHGELDYKLPILNAYVNGVYRTLSASDRLFRGMALHRSLAEQAAAIAGKNKQLARQLAQAPTDDMMVQAIADAELATFSDQTMGATFVKGLQRTFSPVVVPFARTPGNVATRILEYGGGGAIGGLWKAFKAGRNMTAAQQREIANMMGRATTGAPLVAFGFWLASQGKATGARPEGAAGETQNLVGRQANSVRIGNTWRSVNRVSPLGNLIALGANLYELGQDPSGWNAASAALGAGSSALETVGEQASLQGVQNVLTMILDKGQRGNVAGRYATSLAGSAVPALAAHAAQAIDPAVRDARSPGAAMQARVPVWSQNLPARVDQLGQTMTRDNLLGGALYDFTSPRRDRTDDPVRGEIQRVGAEIGSLRRKPDETPEQYEKRSRQTGMLVDWALRRTIQYGAYRRLPDDLKAATLEYVVAQVRAGRRFDPSRAIERVRDRRETSP